MARKSEPAPEIVDDGYYDIVLTRPFEYPPGSNQFLNPGAKVSVKGKVLRLIPKENIADAKRTDTT